ncbi:DUF3618 domain-containing protein [Pararhizobium sp. BT-229]|uniref:DUF3618 domain-containing protein n=1 Tax=Pararhizobium sp. BT-229 TaxID=2986923 RepID=UPI0021F7788D|nr:DUF3618 domain-containing protein [Pararhizobium sp. BT-229]MCV9966844.1 DUF3618 domain-containing protein [Pararhizobium sp. BT-229]
MDHSVEKTSADIQREIEVDRLRIEERIDAIQERMSPGQLVDEMLAYAKGSGGGEYVSNLGQALKSNPLPVALMGVSLAWLMAKQRSTPSTLNTDRADEYPLYFAKGDVRRVGPAVLEGDARYSQFTDESGREFKALTDAEGRRAGHFVDEAGNTYRGFVDASGRQIERILDETGKMLDQASGWGSQAWTRVKDAAGQAGEKASNLASSVSQSSESAATTIQHQVDSLNRTILTHFRNQPLVGGALAFAAGAAIGAALPPTEQEDSALGKSADKLKKNATTQAVDAFDQGREAASEVYEKAMAVASDVHDAAKDRMVDEVESLKHSREIGEDHR